jgi:hypothetical protein
MSLTKQTLEIPTGKPMRHATEPSPADSAYKLFPASPSHPRLPHISTLHRPRPIKRSRASPPSLGSPATLDSRLSPALERDELIPEEDEDDGSGLTPTPSTPASPTTPTSLPAHETRSRKNSWDAPSLAETGVASSPEDGAAAPRLMGLGQHHRDLSWETITVGARLSAHEWSMFAATHHNNSSTVAVPLVPAAHVHEPMPPAAGATTLAAALAYAATAAATDAPQTPELTPPPAATAADEDVTPKAAAFVAADAHAEIHSMDEKVEAAAAAAAAARAAGDEDDWFAYAPQVAVARSLSVTRASSQRALTVVRPVRSSSRQVVSIVNRSVGSGGGGAAVKRVALASSSTASLVSSASLMSSSSLSSSASSSGAGAVKPVGVSARLVDSPLPAITVVDGSAASSGGDGPSRSASTRQDLQRELFGERGLGERRGLSVGAGRAVVEQVREIGAQLTPRMCVVEEEENRKSVWGLIESA